MKEAVEAEIKAATGSLGVEVEEVEEEVEAESTEEASAMAEASPAPPRPPPDSWVARSVMGRMAAPLLPQGSTTVTHATTLPPASPP